MSNNFSSTTMVKDLPESKIPLIEKDLFEDNMSKRDVARKYEVNLETVDLIIRSSKISQSIKDRIPEGEVLPEEMRDHEEDLKAARKINAKTKYKLSDEQILEAMIAYEEGKSPKDLAKKYGVSATTIHNYAIRWKVVRDPDLLEKRAKNTQKKAQENKRAEEEKKGQKTSTTKVTPVVEEKIEEKPVQQQEVIAQVEVSQTINVPEKKVEENVHEVVHIKPSITSNGSNTSRIDYVHGCPIILESEYSGRKCNLLYEKMQTIEVGMIDERHDMPCDNFIFASVDPKKMFDYRKLDTTTNNFLDKNIGFFKTKDGTYVGKKNLVVYVTGLTCVLASIIKCCSDRHVNLTLKHYNRDKKEYEDQPIFTSNPEFHSEYEKVFVDASRVYMDDCDIKSIMSGNVTFYSISINCYDRNNTLIDRTIIIGTDMGSLWARFSNMCVSILTEKEERLTAIFRESKIFNGKEKQLRMLTKTSNFEYK